MGLETGEAVVDVAAAEAGHQRMSVGSCVNVAARLQQLAEPGTVLVGPACHEANVEVGDFVPVGEVELKGVGLVPAWRLVEQAPLRASRRLPLASSSSRLAGMVKASKPAVPSILSVRARATGRSSSWGCISATGKSSARR